MLACDAVKAKRLALPRRQVTLRAVHPNVGIEVEYQKRLDALVTEMQASLVHWLTAAYRANEPRIGQDARRRATPANVLQRVFDRLSRRWLKRIDDAAPKLAEWFATAAMKRSDDALRKILKDGGFTVKFDPTPTTTDIFKATLNENVSLIRSIASEHLADVEQLVMRSVSVGRDLGSLSKALQERHGVTQRRAALISRDQNNKATAAITRSRQQELGIETAIWRHSSAGKHPRPSHVAMNNKPYSVKDGVMLDGERCWPGTAINCRCTSKIVVPGFS